MQVVMLIVLKRRVTHIGDARQGHVLLAQGGKKERRRHFLAIDDDGRVRGFHQGCQVLVGASRRILHAGLWRGQIVLENQPGAVIA